uniref:Protein nlrc3 n=1 Tax=Rhipicephalus appendiculatus TaxID=34631 RepID=A0A131Z5B8_RHIAP
MGAPSTLGMESAIRSLDSARLLLMAGRLLHKLKSGGVDLQAPCSDVVGETKCWLRLHLPAVNQVLWKVSMQVVEHAPGALTLTHIETTDLDTVRADASFMDGAILLYSLLERHACIKRLLLSTMAFPLWHFPSLLGNAVRANRGIKEVEGHPNDKVVHWREVRPYRTLPCALGNGSQRLSCLNVTSLKLDHVAAECIADGITRSNLQRLHLYNEMSATVARKLLSAVSSCHSLTSLEFAGSREFSLCSAKALASALKCNRTLRKLRVNYMAADVLGIILASLRHNQALQELSLDCSVDFLRSTLWDGLQALRDNRVLKRLEITDAHFSNSCAIVIAQVLRHNNALEELSLYMNSISDLGARALARTLQESSSIKRLDVSNCRLTSKVVSKFVETVSRNRAVERVRLGDLDIPEDWAPTVPLTEDVCSRLQVPWNTLALEQWGESLKRNGFRLPKACLGWTKDVNSSAIVQWFSAARVNSASLVELVIECPRPVDAKSTEAVASFLETTHSLKKLIVRPIEQDYVFSSVVLNSLVRNKSICEAEFYQTLRTPRDIKALEALLLANRTLHRLKFSYDSLPSKAPARLARALKDNVVFLTLEFEYQHAQSDMYPVVKTLNRNRSLLNRAVECVLDAARDEHSTRALRLLSATESLLDAVSVASGKVRHECRCLVLQAVRSLE